MFPATIATPDDLAVAINRFTAKLAASVLASDVTFTLASVQNGPPAIGQLLSLDNEIVRIESVNGAQIGVTRAFDGTSAAPHAKDAIVQGKLVSWHHNALAIEIMAVENALGQNLVNVSKSSQAYHFMPQQPGGTLSAGANTITLSPVPPGVNGTDQFHYLWISGGTGTPEAALIIGGSASAGAPSGTLIIQCANPHSGAWTIQSATAGIQEAIQAFGSSGGAIHVPSGDYTIHATITILAAGTTIYGDGGSTMLRAGSSSLTFISKASMVAFSKLTVRDLLFEGADFPGINGITGISWTQAQKNNVERVAFDNIRYAVKFDRVDDTRLKSLDLFDNSQIWIGSTVDGPTGYSWHATLEAINHHATGALGDLGAVIVMQRVASGTIFAFNARNLYGTVKGIQLLNDTQGVQIVASSIVTPSTGIELNSNTVGSTTAGPLQTSLLGVQIDQYTQEGIHIAGALYTGVVEPVITGNNVATTENHAIYIGISTVGTAVRGGRLQNIKRGNGITVDNGARDVVVDGVTFANQLNGADIFLPSSTTTQTVLVANNVRGVADTSDYIANQTTSPTVILRGNLGVDAVEGAGIASAATISPTNPIHQVSGTNTISTITVPAGFSVHNGFTIMLIPTAIWNTNTSGNIAVASTAVVGKPIIYTYLPSTGKWYPSY